MGLFSRKLSTEPYKGVRDFYPEDMQFQNWLFGIWRKTVESFGYIEYTASILEPSDLYKAKSGDEIVNEQTYTFKDRGGRDVTIRPEMTPTLARMIAAKERELAFPIRWYSIPNLFRYENPQRGRLREHWQLNVDVFGIHSFEADIEIIAIASKIMRNLGAKDSDFEIRINSRALINDLYEMYGLNKDKSQKLSRLIDKKDKISADAFKEGVELLVGEKTEEFMQTLSSNKSLVGKLGENHREIKNLVHVIDVLGNAGIKNIVFDPTLMRGFDYYTGFVFEVFDTDRRNKRALFGGGRYDELLDIFGKRKIPAVGFGMGDVTARDFLETHNLMPDYKPLTDLYICVLDQKHAEAISRIADQMRSEGSRIAIDWSGRKIGDQIKTADKQKVPYIAVIGENEIKIGELRIKNLASGKEKTVKIEDAKSIF